jgi:hypothetical protein
MIYLTGAALTVRKGNIRLVHTHNIATHSLLFAPIMTERIVPGIQALAI